METVYTIVNASVMPFWALLAFAPRHELTQRLVHVAAIPMLLGIAYVSFLGFGTVIDAPENAGFFSMAALRNTFTSDYALLGAWVHYLAFDLFVGAWIGRDSLRNNISHMVVVPSLFFTLMAGPLGLLIYLLVRGIKTGKWQLNEA